MKLNVKDYQISRLFKKTQRKVIESRIKTALNEHSQTVRIDGLWEVGSLLERNFNNIFGDLGCNYSGKFARRSMADLAFTDQDDFYYMVDVKTHRLETKFNMPNLTSIERLTRLYEDDLNYYIILMVDYNIVSNKRIRIKKVHFLPIEFLSWECLRIESLGWGQIQIANANNIVVNYKYSRKKWMLELCDIMFEYYPREILKIKDRIKYFKRVKNQWKKKKDIWK